MAEEGGNKTLGNSWSVLSLSGPSFLLRDSDLTGFHLFSDCGGHAEVASQKLAGRGG